MIPKRLYLPAVLAVCLLLLQTVPFLSARWVEDESWYGSVGYTFFHEGRLRNPMFPPMDNDSHVDMRPPMTALTVGAAFRSLGMEAGRARVPFLLAGAGSVALVFLIGLELGSPLAAALAALLLATDNLFFVVCRTVRSEALVIFFGCLGVLLFLVSRRRQKPLLALASGLALGVGFDCHPNALAALAAVGLFLLMEFRLRIFTKAAFWALAAGVLIAISPFLIWAASSPLHRANTVVMYTKGQGPALSDIPAIEKMRYTDFLGFGGRKAGLPIAIPYRLHIGFAIVAAFWALWRYKRAQFWSCLAFVLPCVLLWAFERHPTTRYMAVAAPWFAILIALAAVRLADVNPSARRLAYAAVGLVLLTQLAGNAILLNSFRKADYNQVARQLRAIIPPGRPVYGAATFWLALYDHPYASWNRTPLSYAVSDEHVEYMILNDRVLLHGSGFGKDDWADTRETADRFVRDHATAVGRVDSPFYGDLQIYRVQASAVGQ